MFVFTQSSYILINIFVFFLEIYYNINIFSTLIILLIGLLSFIFRLSEVFIK